MEAIMIVKISRYSFIALISISLIFGFCGIGQASSDKPQKLNIGIIVQSYLDDPWNSSLIQSLDRVKKEKPHGLDISWDVNENVSSPDAKRVLNTLAKSGKYQIIWANSAYSEAVIPLSKEYPEILWVLGGEGNQTPGGNVYVYVTKSHESAYLCGMLAALMSKTGTIGVVSHFPYPGINVPINGYIAGAKSVNPNIKYKISFIESWYDPVKGKEAAMGQIAAKADVILAQVMGPIQACTDKGVYAIGGITDRNSLGPNTVLTSNLCLADPALKTIINSWWDHVTEGVPYNAPKGELMYDLAGGGSDIAPFHSLDSKIPDSVKEKISKAKKDIIAGKITVPYNREIPKSSK
jgi:basic membrane protein A and related proteins